jgi:diguanylate cyclase (GGDEF)-like protein
MRHVVWRSKSLRFWLAFGLVLSVLPLVAAAVLGHILLNRGVIASLGDIATRHRYELAPAYRLGTVLLEAVEPVDEFVDAGDPTRPPAYRVSRQQVEAAFAALHDRFGDETEPRTLVERALEDWTAADIVASEILSVHRPGGDPQGVLLMERFHGRIGAAIDKMAALAASLETDLTQDHDRALLSYERADWVTGIASVVSVLAIVAAVVVIGRVVSGSVDRLVDGAERFATGDRKHRIDVQVPPELNRVAEEFNRMIARIHESESALAELARRDGLTNLLNRRAFDEALAETFERLDRLGGAAAVVLIDIDAFKRINDTHGHGAGDDVLAAVARTLTADVRLIDRVFRVGGEEFAVLLVGADAAAAETTAERLRQTVEADPVATRSGAIGVTISLGVASAWRGSDAAALVAAADAALYRAKSAGRNRTVIAGAAASH